MSGIVGIYNLDGRPVDEELLGRMTEALAHRGPDASGQWIAGPVGLGQRMLHTTPESLHETQPLLDETGQLCLVLDGRVDNREQLSKALQDRGALLRTDTDAELVLRAYQCWDEQSPREIVGDFSFAIWDGRKRRLFCARDAIGIRPFYYHLRDNTFRLASELRQILIDPNVPREPNEGMIGEYLAHCIVDREETLFTGIYRLPPAHYLIIDRGGIRKQRYWNIDPAAEIRHRNDQEYAEHFLDIFQESVRCRLRSHGPVGADLSGGLDSSSVVCMAQDLYRKGLAENHGFETFSLVFPGLPCDESSFIDEVVKKWDLKSNKLSPEVTDADFHVEKVRADFDFPMYPNGTMHYGHYSQARAKGIRVLLTGDGGDQWLQGSQWHLADLLRSFRLRDLFHQVCLEKAPEEIRQTFPLLRAGLWPLLPRTLQDLVRALMRRRLVPDWINPGLAQRAHLQDRLERGRMAKYCLRYSTDLLYKTLNSGRLVFAFDCMDRDYSSFSLEGRHPFYDRRLIEFCLALPEEQRRRGEQTKFVLRQAMRKLLPENICQRLTKGSFDHFVAKSLLSSSYRRVLDQSNHGHDDWVNGARIRWMRGQLSRLHTNGQEDQFQFFFPFWMVLAMKLWRDSLQKTDCFSWAGKSNNQAKQKLIAGGPIHE